MSNLTSHKTSTGYNALPYSVDGSITFDAANPQQFAKKAVMLVGNRTVGLVTTGSKVLGSIVVVEANDGDGVKASVQHAGQIPFKNSDGAPAVTPGSGVVGGATAGDVADAGVDTDSFGIVTSLEADGTIIVIPR